MTPKNGIAETGKPGMKVADDLLPVNPDGLIARFLSGVPAHLAASFTEAQLSAVKDFVIDSRARQAVDIRWSIPFFWFRFFIVVLAGPERRSTQRLAADRALRPLWTWGNAIVIAVFLAMLCTSFVGMHYALRMSSVLGVN